MKFSTIIKLYTILYLYSSIIINAGCNDKNACCNDKKKNIEDIKFKHHTKITLTSEKYNDFNKNNNELRGIFCNTKFEDQGKEFVFYAEDDDQDKEVNIVVIVKELYNKITDNELKNAFVQIPGEDLYAIIKSPKYSSSIKKIDNKYNEFEFILKNK